KAVTQPSPGRRASSGMTSISVRKEVKPETIPEGGGRKGRPCAARTAAADGPASAWAAARRSAAIRRAWRLEATIPPLGARELISPTLITRFPDGRKGEERRAAMAVGGVDPGSLLA